MRPISNGHPTVSASRLRSSSPSTAPRNRRASPLALMMTNAGCTGTPKRANTLPGSSLICGNDREYLSMNPWNDCSSPVHATPTKSTFPAHSCAAASTEAASRLQVLQVGAQNQNAVVRPA